MPSFTGRSGAPVPSTTKLLYEGERTMFGVPEDERRYYSLDGRDVVDAVKGL